MFEHERRCSQACSSDRAFVITVILTTLDRQARNAIRLESLHDRAKAQFARIELGHAVLALTHHDVDLNRQCRKQLQDLLPTPFDSL